MLSVLTHAMCSNIRDKYSSVLLLVLGMEYPLLPSVDIQRSVRCGGEVQSPVQPQGPIVRNDAVAPRTGYEHGLIDESRLHRFQDPVGLLKGEQKVTRGTPEDRNSRFLPRVGGGTLFKGYSSTTPGAGEGL